MSDACSRSVRLDAPVALAPVTIRLESAVISQLSPWTHDSWRPSMPAGVTMSTFSILILLGFPGSLVRTRPSPPLASRWFAEPSSCDSTVSNSATRVTLPLSDATEMVMLSG